MHKKNEVKKIITGKHNTFTMIMHSLHELKKYIKKYSKLIVKSWRNVKKIPAKKNMKTNNTILVVFRTAILKKTFAR